MKALITSCKFFRYWAESRRDVTRGTLFRGYLQSRIKTRFSLTNITFFPVFGTMVKRCIAAGCSNTYRENVSLFCFPRDSALKERWTKQVRRTRAGWSGPTANSYLCSDHFSEDCFERDTLMAAKLGIQKRKKLKPDAVPTIFERNKQHAAPPSKKRTGSSEPDCSQAAKKPRSGYEKRERARVNHL